MVIRARFSNQVPHRFRPHFLVVFGILWSGITLFFDGIAATGVVQAVIAQLTYSEASGVVLQSDSVKDAGVIRAQLRYSFEVAGRPYTGSRYSFGYWDDKGGQAGRIVARYPPGTRTTVYYSEHDPTRSSIHARLTPVQLLSIQTFTMHNVAMVWFWWMGWSSLRRRHRGPGNNWWISGLGPRAVVRLTRYRPIAIGSFALSFASILLGLLVSFATLLDPTEWVAWGSNAAAWGIALAFLWRHSRAIARGRYDLILDRRNNTLTIPPGTKTPGMTCPFNEIQTVQSEPVGNGWYSLIRFVRRSGDSFVLDLKIDRQVADRAVLWIRGELKRLRSTSARSNAKGEK